MTPSDAASRIKILPSSFRDPDGYLFRRSDVLYRAVRESYRENYEQLMNSGLYQKLTAGRQLIGHKEVDMDKDSSVWLVIRPETVDFISYPYEWCFSQIKDSALLTLDIQLDALRHGMSLKDASAYNIQFQRGCPVMIDTLSFEKYEEGQPWAAYHQFCQHFLAPLALMACKDAELNKLMIAYVNGIPLSLAGRLLPLSSWFKFGLLMHIHTHALTRNIFNRKNVFSAGGKRGNYVSKKGLTGIIQSLRNTVNKLDWKPGNTPWSDYYNTAIYSDSAFSDKQRIVRDFLQKANPDNVWDFGANTGVFSRIAAGLNISVISFDADPSAVELNYRAVREQGEERILPLLLDLTNPSPGLGWHNNERDSFMKRGPADCIMALALIHHLALSNNLPLYKIAEFFSTLCKYLIIEFIPKKDSQVQKMLSSRVDIFKDYDKNIFESIFSRYFTINCSESIMDSERTLYLMQKK